MALGDARRLSDSLWASETHSGLAVADIAMMDNQNIIGEGRDVGGSTDPEQPGRLRRDRNA